LLKKLKIFAALLIIYKLPTKLFWWFNKTIFSRSVSRSTVSRSTNAKF